LIVVVGEEKVKAGMYGQWSMVIKDYGNLISNANA
jgi:hypothetical protein